eukprot:scaffold102039_cov21-Phaeocystis_antarctica.AAC.1
MSVAADCSGGERRSGAPARQECERGERGERGVRSHVIARLTRAPAPVLARLATAHARHVRVRASSPRRQTAESGRRHWRLG